MENKTEVNTSKHWHGFWPLFGLFVVAMILGGIITMFAYNSGLQEELNSINFKIHKPAADKK